MVNYVTVQVDPEIAVSPFNGDAPEIDDPVIHGDAAGCLSDDSDATYVEIPATDEVFSSGVAGILKPRRVTRDESVTAKVRIRTKGPADFRVTVSSSIAGEDWLEASTPDPPPSTPTWVELELSENDRSSLSNPMALLLAYLNGGAVSYTMSMTVYTSGGPENARLYVYEAQLLVPGPAGPPASCRGFPASTSSSVGGTARGFPPSKFGRIAGGHL